MVNLSVNINKVATLRNARGGNVPDVELVAVDCQQFGADGITVHPRPDERHIRRNDVTALKPLVHTEFNIEGYPSDDFLRLVLEVRPTQVTLVPDAPDALTSSAGWDVAANFEQLKSIVSRLNEAGIRVSLFIGPEAETAKLAALTGAQRVELYTEPYARLYSSDRQKAVAPYVEAAEAAHNAGLGVNAGHDLSLQNLKFFKQNMPHLDEVSIGHALIADALYMGLENAIKAYKQQLL